MQAPEPITTHIRIETEKLKRICLNTTDKDVLEALRTVAAEYAKRCGEGGS